MKKILIIFILFLSYTLFSQEGYKSLVSGNMKFSWKVNGDFIDFKISAKTNGWISVGFNPTTKMKNATMVLGVMKEGIPNFTYHYGTANFKHKSIEDLGGKNLITNPKGTEGKDLSEISFSLPLKSDGKYDADFKKGKHVIILAYSISKEFKSKHVYAAKAQFEIK